MVEYICRFLTRCFLYFGEMTCEPVSKAWTWSSRYLNPFYEGMVKLHCSIVLRIYYLYIDSRICGVSSTWQVKALG